MTQNKSHSAFAGEHLVHRGTLVEVLAAIKLRADSSLSPAILIFENATGKQVDFDLRGSLEEVLERARPVEPARGPGRPKLGVESREVSLLPRHWAWLARQPNGASAALRRLVDAQSRIVDPEEAVRARREATYRVMLVLAGNRAGFEEAARALFAGEEAGFVRLIAEWPADVRGQLRWMLSEPPASDDAPSA